MSSGQDFFASIKAAFQGRFEDGQSRAFRVLRAGVLTIPSPALLSMLSGSPVAVIGTVTLSLAGLLLLVWPSGIMGFLLCLLVWTGSLCLGASGLQIAQVRKQMEQLEEEVAGLRETRQIWERDLLNRMKTQSGKL